MSMYTDQVQKRLDRLGRMEPAFEAMREALRECVRPSKQTEMSVRITTLAYDKIRAALALAEGVSK